MARKRVVAITLILFFVCFAFVGLSRAATLDLFGYSTPSDFTNQFGAISFPLSGNYDFLGGANSPDGFVSSNAFYSGSGGLQYVYYYQINISNPTDKSVSGITIPFTTQLSDIQSWSFGGDAGGHQAFFLNGTGTGSDINPVSAFLDEVNGNLKFFFTFEGSASLNPGEISAVFGVFSLLPPASALAELLDSGSLSGAEVKSPVPEPGTMFLLGSGLVGLAGWGRKKFRK